MIDLSARLDASSDDDRMIRDAAAAYCSRDPELRRVRNLRGTQPGFDADAWQELADMGWLGCRVPESLGGMALSYAQTALMLEQFGRSLAPEPLAACAIMSAQTLQASGHEALKALWLPKLAAGQWKPVLAWQEDAAASSEETFSARSGGASDGWPVATRATVHGDRVKLMGAKRFVPHGDSADAFIVSAEGPSGPALYLIPRDAAGLRIVTRPRVDGGHWSELILDGVSLGPDAEIAQGESARTALRGALDTGRLAVGAELVGLMGRAFEITIDYLKVREQFDRRIGSFQALQHRATDLLVLVELSRSVLHRAARQFDETDEPTARAMAASQLKARASDAAVQVVKGCIQLHGGIGYTDDCNIGLFLKRAMVLAAWLGGADAHRLRYGQLADRTVGRSDQPVTDEPLRLEARALLAEHFPQAWRYPATRMSLRDTADWQKTLAAKGWMAPGWPREHGGMGLSTYEQIVLAEEFDRHGLSIVSNMGVTMLGPLLIRYGTAEQKRKYLPAILKGDVRWCQGYSEPGAGSDLASLRTRAVLEGDTFTVNGQKIWTTYAHEADMIFLLVRTDPQAKKQDGISFLLVDMRTPGITVKPIRNLTGESEFCEVFFDDVKVPRDNLVGELNRGWSMAKSLLGSERISIGSPRLARYPLHLLQGLMQAQGLMNDPVQRARFDRLRLEVDDLSAAFMRMAEVLRRGNELGAEVSILKIWVTETMQRVTDMLLECQAEAGTLDEVVPLSDGTSVHVAGQYFLSRPATIYGGSNEIQRNILAKAILELPG
jgi:alkylation response protein AidB-like acyl-CoA dehydrogenase